MTRRSTREQYEATLARLKRLEDGDWIGEVAHRKAQQAADARALRTAEEQERERQDRVRRTNVGALGIIGSAFKPRGR